MSRFIVCFVACLIVSSALAQPTTQRGRQDSFDAIHQFYLTEGPEAYKAVGVRNPAWDNDAIKFLTMRVESQAYDGLGYMYRTPKLASNVEQRQLGQKLLDAGCTDPQVLYQIARACEKTAESGLARKILTQAEKGINASGYSAYQKLRMARYRLDLGEEQKDPQRRKASEARFLQCLIDCLADPGFSKNSRDVRWDVFEDDFDEGAYSSLCSAALEKVMNNPNLDPWLYHSLAGRLEIRLGWESRGSGWASTVTADGWRGFSEHLAKARDHLTQAWNLDKTQPQPAADMITVAMGAGDELNESIDTWFTRATDAQFDFVPAYMKYQYAIQPKWGGSILQLDAFATRCLNTQRFDSMVPHQVITLANVWYAQTQGVFDPSIVPGLPEKLLACCDGYIAAGKARGLPIITPQSEKLTILYSLKRFSEARALLDEMQGKYDSTPLERQFLWDVDVISEIHARTGAHAAEIEKLLEHSETRPPTRVLEDARALLQSLPNNAPESHYLRTFAAEVEFNGKLATGDWIDVPTEDNLSQWKTIYNKWKLDPDGRMTTKCEPDSSGLVVFLPRLPKNYEISCTVEVKDDPDNNSYAQVYMSFGDLANGAYGAYSPLTKKVCIGSNHRSRRSMSCDADPKRYELLLRVENGDRFTTTINGKTTVSYQASLVPGDRERRLALNTNQHPTAVFSFSKIRIRTLPIEAGPDEKMKK